MGYINYLPSISILPRHSTFLNHDGTENVGLTIVAVVVGILLYIVWGTLDRSTRQQKIILEMLPQVLAEVRGEQRTRS